MSGKLFLVGTPIGNLGDISERCAETLAAVDFIAAEDTRVSRKLLNHLDIRKPLVSYYEHNARESGASKGAVAAYTASLAAETGLRVNALAPGLIDVEGLHGTELEKQWKNHTVRKQMMSPVELADMVLFLARSTGIYGQTILADNGYCLK